MYSEINSNIEDTPSTTTTVAVTSSSSLAITPAVSKPRYSGRSQCDCPNCQEADSLGPVMSAQLKKRNIHSCHIAGCGKIYNKTSHLKAHLRLFLLFNLFTINQIFNKFNIFKTKFTHKIINFVIINIFLEVHFRYHYCFLN